MRYRAKLESALSEAFDVASADDHGFLLRRADGPSVRVVASEEVVVARARAMASDALLALGEVDDDLSGMTAAVGLLAIHVEELVASQDAVDVVRITPCGVCGGHGSRNASHGGEASSGLYTVFRTDET